jgi:hypothetical protein
MLYNIRTTLGLLQILLNFFGVILKDDAIIFLGFFERNGYNRVMTKLQEFISDRPGFLWWVQDVSKIDDSAIVEATLTYGNMEEKKELLALMGHEKFKKEFENITHSRRAKNLEPRTISYWSRYLSINA